ncbi:MAG: acyltransferase family protein [Myxococcota bacterium]|nr:acyltransferase family protein [Myxococcota bacterium]
MGSDNTPRKPDSRRLTSKADRSAYIDNFRIWLTAMVILHHAAIAYGGSGSWWIKDPAADEISRFLLPLFNAFNQSYFMSAFFLLAGFFTPASFDAKGAATFVKGRLMRLGIPLIFNAIVLVNVTRFLIRAGRDEPFEWIWTTATTHLWFVQALLMFSLIYAVVRLVFPRAKPVKWSAGRYPSHPQLLVTAVLLAAGSFCVRVFYPIGEEWFYLQLGFFTHYTFCFFIGIVAYRGDWLGRIGKTQKRLAKGIAISLIPALMILGILGGILDDSERFVQKVSGGITWQSLGYSVWESLAMVALITYFLYLFFHRYNRAGNINRWVAANTYGIYIFHAPVLVGFNVALLPVPIPTIAKLVIAAVGTGLLSLAITAVLRKSAWVRRVL